MSELANDHPKSCHGTDETVGSNCRRARSRTCKQTHSKSRKCIQTRSKSPKYQNTQAVQPALAPLSPPKTRSSQRLSSSSFPASLLLMEPTHFSPNQSSSFNAAKKQPKAQTSVHDSEVPSRNSMGSHVSEEAMFTPRSRRGQRQRCRNRHFRNNSNDLSNVDEDMGDAG